MSSKIFSSAQHRMFCCSCIVFTRLSREKIFVWDYEAKKISGHLIHGTNVLSIMITINTKKKKAVKSKFSLMFSFIKQTTQPRKCQGEITSEYRISETITNKKSNLFLLQYDGNHGSPHFPIRCSSEQCLLTIMSIYSSRTSLDRSKSESAILWVRKHPATPFSPMKHHSPLAHPLLFVCQVFS